MNKKYELTDETKEIGGITLHRIRALRDIPRHGVTSGDLGGWIEKEDNLLHEGDAWVLGDALVYGDARVSGNACVFGDARVSDNARVSGNARVSCNVRVYGDAEVSGNVRVFGDAEVYGNAEVFGDARVFDNAEVFGDALVYGDACVGGDAQVYGDAQVFGDAQVSGNVRVYGDAQVCGDALVCGDAIVDKEADYMTFKNTWSSGRYFTYTCSNKMWKVGCFYGNGEELIKKAYADSETSGKCYEAIVRAVETIEAAQAEAKGETDGSK